MIGKCFCGKFTIPNEGVFLYVFGPFVNNYLELDPAPYSIAFLRYFQGAKVELIGKKSMMCWKIAGILGRKANFLHYHKP